MRDAQTNVAELTRELRDTQKDNLHLKERNSDLKESNIELKESISELRKTNSDLRDSNSQTSVSITVDMLSIHVLFNLLVQSSYCRRSSLN